MRFFVLSTFIRSLSRLEVIKQSKYRRITTYFPGNVGNNSVNRQELSELKCLYIQLLLLIFKAIDLIPISNN